MNGVQGKHKGMWPLEPRALLRIENIGSTLILISLCLGVACGKVGPPLYPEEIGLAVKQEEHRKQQALETSEPNSDISQAGEPRRPLLDNVPEEGDVALPPLRPLSSQ